MRESIHCMTRSVLHLATVEREAKGYSLDGVGANPTCYSKVLLVTHVNKTRTPFNTFPCTSVVQLEKMTPFQICGVSFTEAVTVYL